jgi:hypothetical protein
MDRNQWLLSRRALLGGLSAAGMAALMPGSMRSRARAQAAVPTRLLLFHVPEGMWSGAPRPKAGGTDLGPILAALQPYQQKTLVVNNMNMKSRDNGPGGDGHHRGVPHMFTCTEMQDENNAGGMSIDQKIANAIGGSSTFPSLQFAVRIVYGDTNARPIWSGPGRVVPAMQSPFEAYDRIFSNFMPSTSMTPAQKPKVDLRKSALDHALSEITTLRAKLSKTDLELMDSYQDSLRDIEKRLAMTPPPAPASCAPPTLGSSIDVKAESNYPKVGQLQMDVMVAALQCGLTRVCSFQYGNSNDQCTYSWLGVNTLGHDMAHNNNNCDPDGSKKLKTYQWYSEQFKYLLDKLDGIPEGDGTMLDNTVVVWASEFSDSNGHSADKLMWMLFGNAAGYFKQGRILDVGGKSLNDFHTTLGNAFGIQDQTFGNPTYCAGPMTELLT